MRPLEPGQARLPSSLPLALAQGIAVPCLAHPVTSLSGGLPSCRHACITPALSHAPLSPAPALTPSYPTVNNAHAQAFKLFDDDNTGFITLKNLKRVAKELGENLTDEELQEMIDEADRDGDGQINEDEFYRWVRCGVG